VNFRQRSDPDFVDFSGAGREPTPSGARQQILHILMLTTNKIVRHASQPLREIQPRSRDRAPPMPHPRDTDATARNAFRCRSDLVVANRILAAEGVLDGFGYVSIRDPACYLMSRSLAPALVTAADILQHDLDSKPTEDTGVGLYYERWIHGEIYRARPQINAIVHSHS
jgi:Class II Aldolase and Adducin N-terminal domain